MTKRFGLLDFILLLGVVASVFGLIWNRKQAEDLQRSVVELRKTAGELVVDDPNLFWLHQRKSLRGERAYDVHVPDGTVHFVALATSGIYSSVEDLPVPMKTMPISSGRHEITYSEYTRSDGKRFHSVSLDGVTEMEIEKSEFRGRGILGEFGHHYSPHSFPTSLGTCHIFSRIVYPKDNKEFQNVQHGNSPTEGFCVWIEAVD